MGLFGKKDLSSWPAEELYAKGEKLYNLHMYGKALPYLEAAAEKGYKWAQTKCALLYDHGEGTEKNMEKSLYWKQKAGEHGDPKYLLDAAFEWYWGVNVPQDKAKALHLCEFAAIWNRAIRENKQPDDMISKEEVGEYLLKKSNGAMLNKQPTHKSFVLLQCAAEFGHPDAQFQCAEMYENGGGVPSDISKALYWYEKAIENGYTAAYEACGLIYYYGKGVPVDRQKAREYFEAGVKSGDPGSGLFLEEQFEDYDGDINELSGFNAIKDKVMNVEIPGLSESIAKHLDEFRNDIKKNK